MKVVCARGLSPASRADKSMSESRDGLRNVFWLGGSPCAGKSSMSEVMARQFELDVYHVDEAFERHVQRLEPARQPALAKWCSSSWDERWMQPTGDLLQNVIACYREHFALILKDVLTIAKDKPLLVEGTALLPRHVAEVLPNRNQAAWVIAGADFQREHYRRREWARGIVNQCHDPELAFRNWMERDVQFAGWVRAEVTALGLRLLEVDGSRSVEENAESIAAYFQLCRNRRSDAATATPPPDNSFDPPDR